MTKITDNGNEIDVAEISEETPLLWVLSHPVQKAWKEHSVPQCGYCQAGQIMMAAALLESNKDPSDDEIDSHMWNICRCGTYNRIREAIKDAAKEVDQ